MRARPVACSLVCGLLFPMLAPAQGVFVESDPPGAAIILLQKRSVEEVFVENDPAGTAIRVLDFGVDTGLVTPALVRLPPGKHAITLALEGYEPATLALDSDEGIQKPGVVKLTLKTVVVNVVSAVHLGRRVFVNGNPVTDAAGANAVVPCTLRLAKGRYDIALVKKGWRDAHTEVRIESLGEPITVDVRLPEIRGASKLAPLLDRPPTRLPTGNTPGPEGRSRFANVKVTLKKPYPASYRGAETDRISVQYAVTELARQVGLKYEWTESYANTDPVCRQWICPNIQNQPFHAAMTEMLEAVGLTYEIRDGATVVLSRKKP
mgnify:CR=1 FL=1